jgi:phosphoglycolate phosphatase-like HAD superfamily hydrolase
MIMPAPNIIAILCDFDDTLGKDATNILLREMLSMDEDVINRFWNKDVSERVKKGWDPPLAYISIILELLKARNITVKNQDLRKLGCKVELFPGVPTLFQRLKSFVTTRSEFQESHIQIEFYVITGGLEEIIKGTPIGCEMTDIFGCTFDDSTDVLTTKSIVTFTEKTKFLYAINKGISGPEVRRNPYSVNEVVNKDSRRIPFTNMIYIGDGPTDIPCFSAIQQYGGKTVGVLKYRKEAGQVIVDNTRAWAIAKGDRVTLGPFRPNYEEDSDLYVNLRLQVERVGLDITDKDKRLR